MPACDVVLSDADLVLLILQQCSTRGLGRAARVCTSWRDCIREKELDKAELRRWCIASCTGTLTNLSPKKAITKKTPRKGKYAVISDGGGGNMFQISVIGALLLKRPHCMAMHETLKLPKDSSGNGNPMPATFDLLMDDSPTARGSQLWRDMKDGPRVHGLRVELGWAAFVRRANKEVEHHADQRRLAEI